MVREFYLQNEKGQEYSLMDIKNYCLLTEPSRFRIFLQQRIRTSWKYICGDIWKNRTKTNKWNS